MTCASIINIVEVPWHWDCFYLHCINGSFLSRKWSHRVLVTARRRCTGQLGIIERNLHNEASSWFVTVNIDTSFGCIYVSAWHFNLINSTNSASCQISCVTQSVYIQWYWATLNPGLGGADSNTCRHFHYLPRTDTIKQSLQHFDHDVFGGFKSSCQNFLHVYDDIRVNIKKHLYNN